MPFTRSKAWIVSATAVPVIALAILATPLRAKAAAPELSSSSNHLVFADVVVGQTETLSVVATNNGPSNVTILSVGVTDNEFKLANLSLPQVLAAGESLGVNVTFAPTVRGLVGGAVVFVSNATNRIVSVALSGTGVTREAVTVSPRSLS